MTNPDLSQTSIQYIKGVGPARKKLFANLGVETVEDLMYLFPRRYEDRRNITKIAETKIGEWQTIIGIVKNHTARKSYYTKKHLTEVLFDDGTGKIFGVWFNQPYLNSYFKPGRKVICYGKVEMYKNRLQMISPEYEILESEDDEHLSLKRIVPVYPLTKGMSQRYIRKVVYNCLEKHQGDLKDELPVALRNQRKLANIKRSIRQIHFPKDFKQQEEAIRRVSFEEFYFFQIAIRLRRLSITAKPGIAHDIKAPFCIQYLDSFPFELTKDQKKAIDQIRDDMQKNRPMLRLLQGDVGSGKTIVALFGCCAAIRDGHQAAFMAPTEILARQHYENIQKMNRGIKVALLVSSIKKKEREKLLKKLAHGSLDLVVGTHALLTEEVQFKDLSFVVVDEQHKFGVRQRAILSEKGINPDVLIMTATPIPRTLCITLYGDLDVSIIKELPKNRGRIKTVQFPHDAEQMVYNKVKERVKEGRQAYIVYPLIDESEKTDIKAAEENFKKFKKETFKDFRVGLVHGRLKQKESEEIMNAFKKGKIDVLVATTVLEVGIDVPNATVMVIEHADRFGLSQLHQLRGRIGRGEHDSQCYLIADPQTDDGKRRLDAIIQTIDGFKIAQADLEIRGPGKFFGRHQHGLNELKVANPATQLDVLEEARTEALELTKGDPELLNHPNIMEIILSRYPTYLQAVTAG